MDSDATMLQVLYIWYTLAGLLWPNRLTRIQRYSVLRTCSYLDTTVSAQYTGRPHYEYEYIPVLLQRRY